MSGPKSGSWRVVNDGSGMSLDEARKLLVHYRQCIMQFSRQLEALKRRDPSVEIHLEPETVADGDPNSAAEMAAELNNRYEIYIRLRDEVGRLQTLVAARELERDRLLQKGLDAARAAAIHVPKVARADQSREVVAKMDRAIARLDPRADDAIRSAMRNTLRLAQEATDLATAELKLASLRIEVDRVNALCRTAAEAEARLDANCVDTLEELAVARDAQDGANDSARAAAIMKEALEDLGYEVMGGFSSAFASGGAGFFQLASWGDYHCQVGNDPEQGRLHINMVRYAENDEPTPDRRRRDREMEETWCGRLPELLRALADRHLSVEIDRAHPAGSIEMQVTSDALVKPKQRTGLPGTKTAQPRFS